MLPLTKEGRKAFVKKRIKDILITQNQGSPPRWFYSPLIKGYSMPTCLAYTCDECGILVWDPDELKGCCHGSGMTQLIYEYRKTADGTPYYELIKQTPYAPEYYLPNELFDVEI